MTTFTCSYKIEADQVNNRLYMIIRGTLIDEYVQRAVSKIVHEVNKLKTGFDVIDDVSELMPATKSDAKKIKKAQHYVIQKGAKRIVRVVKGNKVNNSVAIRIVKKKNNKSIFAQSLEEAEKLLD
jgi:hypothetical protein